MVFDIIIRKYIMNLLCTMKHHKIPYFDLVCLNALNVVPMKPLPPNVF